MVYPFEHMEKNEVLEGILSVRAAIEADSRDVYGVFVDAEKMRKRDRKITGFVSFLKARGMRPELCERSKIDAIVGASEGAGSTHGGVAALVGPRRYTPVGPLLGKTADERGFCVYLDGIEDPYNLGYAVRSLYAAGASGVILPQRDRRSGTAVLARSSAGAFELLTLSELSGSDDAEKRTELVELAHSLGFVTACAGVSERALPVFAYDGGFPLLLFIGGEKRGISPEFYDSADAILSIPYASPDIRYSLPSASVAAVMGFALMRKKAEKPE